MSSLQDQTISPYAFNFTLNVISHEQEFFFWIFSLDRNESLQHSGYMSSFSRTSHQVLLGMSTKFDSKHKKALNVPFFQTKPCISGNLSDNVLSFTETTHISLEFLISIL